MYIVSFKVKKTNRTGKYMFSSIDEANENKSRLQRDSGLKSVRLRKIGS